jgi:hypothetical protein
MQPKIIVQLTFFIESVNFQGLLVAGLAAKGKYLKQIFHTNHMITTITQVALILHPG